MSSLRPWFLPRTLGLRARVRSQEPLIGGTIRFVTQNATRNDAGGEAPGQRQEHPPANTDVKPSATQTQTQTIGKAQPAQQPPAIQAATGILQNLQAIDQTITNAVVPASDLEAIFEGLFLVDNPPHEFSGDDRRAEVQYLRSQGKARAGSPPSHGLKMALKLQAQLASLHHPRSATMYDSLLRHCVSQGQIHQAAIIYVRMVEEWILEGRQPTSPSSAQASSAPTTTAAAPQSDVSSTEVDAWFEGIRSWKMPGETLSPLDRLELWHPGQLVLKERMRNFPIPAHSSPPTRVPAPDQHFLSIILQSVCLDPADSKPLFKSSARALATLANTVLSRTLPINALKDVIRPFRDLPHDPPVFLASSKTRGINVHDPAAASPYTAYTQVHHALMSLLLSPPTFSVSSLGIAGSMGVIPFSRAAIKSLIRYAIGYWRKPGLLTKLLELVGVARHKQRNRDGDSAILNTLFRSTVLAGTDVKRATSSASASAAAGSTRQQQTMNAISMDDETRHREPHNEDLYLSYFAPSTAMAERRLNVLSLPFGRVDRLGNRNEKEMVATIRNLALKDASGKALAQYTLHLLPHLVASSSSSSESAPSPARAAVREQALDIPSAVYSTLISSLCRCPNQDRLVRRVFSVAKEAAQASEWTLPTSIFTDITAMYSRMSALKPVSLADLIAGSSPGIEVASRLSSVASEGAAWIWDQSLSSFNGGVTRPDATWIEEQLRATTLARPEPLADQLNAPGAPVLTKRLDRLKRLQEISYNFSLEAPPGLGQEIAACRQLLENAELRSALAQRLRPVTKRSTPPAQITKATGVAPFNSRISLFTPQLIRAFHTSSRADNNKKTSDQIMQVVEARVQEYRDAIRKQQADSTAAADLGSQIGLSRTLKELEPLNRAWEAYSELASALADSKALLNDPDPTMRAMADEEISSLQEQIDEIVESQLPALLLPEPETDRLSALVELKAGVGGDEAALFVEEVMRMYQRYAQDRSWKVTILSKTPGSLGGTGLKDVTLEIKGPGAFGDFRLERGVHRVQRVPQTESAGRVHTSTIAVVVLPVLEDDGGNKSSNMVHIDEKDVKTEVMRSRGAGGQHVNKTESAVRLTHVPTGVTVSMQDSRSQHQNKAWAWQILRARLLDLQLTQQAEDRRKTRRSQVKGMDRSDKVRTYNFPQDRITDHRIGLTMNGLEGVLEGEGLEYIIRELQKHRESLRLESLLETGEDLDD